MSHQIISLVAATSENLALGKDNRLPWRIREDLIHLKNITKDKVVILGKKTFDSYEYYYTKSGKDFPGKLYIIITRDIHYSTPRENCVIAHSVDEALTIARNTNEKEVFVIGGEQIFRQTIDLADRLYLTVVKGTYEADAFFPDYSQFAKVIEKKDSHNETNEYTFYTLEKN